MQTFWLLSVLLIAETVAMDNLSVRYQWKQLDFEFVSDQVRDELIKNGSYIPENNLPLGLEVYGDRLFVTVPRWKSGVAASLTYINMKDTSSKSPKLRPYPNWAAHNLSDNPEIISPFRIRADHCGRLWVLDTGEENILDKAVIYRPTTLLIYDLHNDNLLRRYQLPDDQTLEHSFFANIAVEDHDCTDTFAYLGDLGGAGIVVYSWKKQDSWRITHESFHHDENYTKFDIMNLKFDWKDDIFGLALSRADSNGYSTLYYHAMASTDEYSINTRFLREPNLLKMHPDNDDGVFKHLGSRGPKGQSGVAFVDQKTDVLFYALVHLNAVCCWRTTNPSYTMESQGRIFMSNITMVFPNDIKVDNEDRLWVLSDRLPLFMYGKLDPNEVNFRILSAPVADAIRGTACDSKLIVPSDRFKPPTVGGGGGGNSRLDTRGEKSTAATGVVGYSFWFVIIVAIFLKN